MLKYLFAGGLFLLAASGVKSQSVSFEKWLSLRQAGTAILSPDGAYIAYTVTSTDWKENTYDVEIWLSKKGIPPFQLTRTVKGSSTSPKWSPDSRWIAFLADRGDKSQIYLIPADGGEAFPLTKEEEGINDFSWSPDGKTVAFTKNDSDSKTQKSIKDRYGAFGEEGRPEPTPTYVYPILQWCEKGALVLRVNYRGSAGYGEKFRALNVRNLGVGDMWDVVSGVEYLQKKGMIDTARMGCMGWSQGGYISAFLTTHTSLFKAISVGAGISDWATYYVSTDITPFTRQYLKATPWEDKAIYEKTSPIAAINNARTPTLIQHGELDKRVPISDAYELYRGLQDRNIPSRLIVYKGFGHGITKPKERLAAIWHNWQWFGKYIWGEDITLPADK